MKKKLIVLTSTLLGLSLMATSIPFGASLIKASTSKTPVTLSSEILPLKPGRGETVTFLPESLTKFWNMEDLTHTYNNKISEIADLTEYSDEIASFANHLGGTESDKAYLKNLFSKYDLFVPTNNVLSWDSKISAKEYQVIISQDSKLETIEREYKVSGSENSVTFINPYTGTDYYWQVIATKNDNSKVYSDIFNFTTSNLPRTIFIEGVSNTRDLGGNVGLNSKRMKQGLIYRGMGLEGISSEGTNEFKNNLGIKTELDLRGIGEGLENYLSSPNYFHYPAPYNYVEGFDLPEMISYKGSGSLVDNFGNAIKVLANKNNYPVYFHCSVGRDRTGFMGLCLDYLCGVSEEVALKEFCLSLFSTSGAFTKGTLEFYNRVLRIRDYINTFPGNNLSEKTENYLIAKAGVTHEECENVRKILLGDIDTGFVPGKTNPNSFTDLAKVTFRKYGESPVIKMVEVGSTLEKPSMSGNGTWYHGNNIWNFETDVVTGDMYLDYISKDKCKVLVHYTGLDIADETMEVSYYSQLDFSRFNKDGYTFKVYDAEYNLLESLLVEDDLTINVIYKSINGYTPKQNSRIIVMAGQSNGAGVGHYQYLEDSLDEAKVREINNGYDNVLLYGYSHEQYMRTFRKVYADYKYSSGGTVGTFGFEISLADRLSKVFPDETTYIVKAAYGGVTLNYDFISPSCDAEVLVPYQEGRERGWMYDILVDVLSSAIREISDTTNTIPMIEAFMWMQGESDAAFEASNNIYLSSFNTFMDDFTTTFKDNLSYKFACYDAGICETSIWPYAKQMNGLKRSRVDDKNVYIDTVSRLTTSFEPVGSVTDQAHYDAACYIDLGHMFADAYLEKTLRGYTHNAIEIEAPEKITLRKGETYEIKDVKALFNGVEVNAKMSYFTKQHVDASDRTYNYFSISGNKMTGTRIGESHLRITAYYQDEVRTILVPVEVTN